MRIQIFFIALYNALDTLHQQAKSISSQLKKENPQVYISTFTFIEVTTIISQRVGRKEAIVAGKDLLESGNFIYIHSTKAIEELSWTIFKEIGKKNISFVDCSIIAVMELENISSLLTFDKKDFTPLQKLYKFNFYDMRL